MRPGRAMVWGLSWATTTLAGLALIVRLTVRDRWVVVAPLFFGTPPAVLAALAAVAAVFWRLRGRPRAAVAHAAAACLCLAWWHQTSFREPDQFPEASDIRVLFWNTAYNGDNWWAVVGTVVRHRPHVIAVTEPAWFMDPRRTVPAWRLEFPDYQLRAIGREEPRMLILAQGRIEEIGSGPLDAGSFYWHGTVDVDGARFHLIVADLPSNPFRSRRAAVEALSDLVAQLGDQPTLVVGDFNLPADSTQLDPLRTRCANAFDTAGSGYAATWPLPLPVLQIDHAWFNRSLAVTRCEADWSRTSDHRPLVAYLARRWLRIGLSPRTRPGDARHPDP